MGSSCIIPFDHNSLLRGRHYDHTHLQRREQLTWLWSQDHHSVEPELKLKSAD